MTEQITGGYFDTSEGALNAPVPFDLSSVTTKVPMSIIKTSETGFEIVSEIKKLDIITPEEIKKFKEAQSFALSNFRDVPAYRPLIVKITSVLNDKNFPTVDMKYWQCKSEAEVHFNELVRDYYKHQRAMIDLEEMEYKIKEISSINNQEVAPNTRIDPNLMNFDKRRMEIKRDQHQYEIKLLEKDIKYRIQEVVDWNTISSYLEKKCEYSLTNYQDHTIKGHMEALKSRIKDPNIKQEDKANFQNQLDTFIKLNKFA